MRLHWDVQTHIITLSDMLMKFVEEIKDRILVVTIHNMHIIIQTQCNVQILELKEWSTVYPFILAVLKF